MEEKLRAKIKSNKSIYARIQELRSKAIKRYVQQMIPDLNSWNLKILKDEVKGFTFKLNRKTSTTDLRKYLRRYLKKSPPLTSQLWEKMIGYFDRSLENFERFFIRPLEIEIAAFEKAKE